MDYVAAGAVLFAAATLYHSYRYPTLVLDDKFSSLHKCFVHYRDSIHHPTTTIPKICIPNAETLRRYNIVMAHFYKKIIKDQYGMTVQLADYDDYIRSASTSNPNTI